MRQVLGRSGRVQAGLLRHTGNNGGMGMLPVEAWGPLVAMVPCQARLPWGSLPGW